MGVCLLFNKYRYLYINYPIGYCDSYCQDNKICTKESNMLRLILVVRCLQLNYAKERNQRDEKNSYCLLLAMEDDERIQDFFIQTNNPPFNSILEVFKIIKKHSKKNILYTNDITNYFKDNCIGGNPSGFTDEIWIIGGPSTIKNYNFEFGSLFVLFNIGGGSDHQQERD